MAAIFCGHLAEQNVPPIAAFGGGNGELECGFSGSVA
jgi:hypothetical protein